MRMRWTCSEPANFWEPCGNGSLTSFATVSTIRATSWGGSFRKSFLVELRHRMSKDAIALQFADELLVRDGGLAAALGDHSQVLQILQQLFVIGDRKHHSRLFSVLVGQIL